MGLPESDVRAAVARDEHGKVNFGCHAHDVARHSVASAGPETAAGEPFRGQSRVSPHF